MVGAGLEGVDRAAGGPRRTAAWSWAALVLLSLAAALLAPAPAQAETNWRALKHMNIAHQGGENEAPSATMYALERAMRVGSDMLEIDIHTSKDGELVVLHDATVDRTTNGSGRVYDMTLREIQRLDAAHYFVPGENARSGRPDSHYPFRGVRLGKRKPPAGFRPRDFRIPTLDEVMEAYPRVPINIEIKGAADADLASFFRNADALAAYLNDLGRTRGIIVASFNDLALERFRQAAPQIDLAPGLAGAGAYSTARVPPGPGYVAFQVPTEFAGVPVADRRFVEDAHADGYAVHVWTINDEPTMHRLFNWGVEGIMTAEVARLEKVLCAREEQRPARHRSYPGRHCNPRASIACDVAPTRVRRGKGGRLQLTLARSDDFAGRCAGRAHVRFLAAGGKPTRHVRFNFGDKRPSAGGRSERTVALALPKRLRAAARRGAKLRVGARPWHAFPARARLTVR